MSPPGDDPSTSDDDEFRRVADLTAEGDLAGARDALNGLAERATAAGRSRTAARALRLSAGLGRVLGDLDGAVAAAGRAADLAGADDDLAVAAYTELGESLVATGRPGEGADAYGRAADRARTATDRGALRRMRALALTAAGRGAEAAAILGDLAAAETDPTARASLLIQAAGGARDGADAVRLWRDAHDAVEAAATSARETASVDTMRADLAFVDAAAALDARDLPRALGQIRAARRYALDGVAIVQYIAAAVAESSVAELIGDDVTAYGSLATGYATLGDVVGKPLSASTFEGPLRTLRDRWGPDRFARAKRAYEDERRRARVT